MILSTGARTDLAVTVLFWAGVMHTASERERNWIEIELKLKTISKLKLCLLLGSW